jgi:hypothetical protein
LYFVAGAAVPEIIYDLNSGNGARDQSAYRLALNDVH